MKIVFGCMTRTTSFITSIAMILGLFAFQQLAFAAPGINHQIPFEGYLKDTAGVPVPDANYDMVFDFYDAAAAGSNLWTGTHTAANGNDVAVASGTFQVLLGSGAGNTLDGVNFNDDAIYLEITIEGEVMSPRYRIGAAAYSFNSDTVDGFHASDFLASTTVLSDLGDTGSFLQSGTTTDALAEGATNLFFTETRSRGALSETIAGIDYNNTTGLLSTTAGYAIPLTASTSQWDTAFGWGDHSTPGYLTAITGQSLESLSDVAAMAQNNGDLLTWNGAVWTSVATSSLGVGGGATTLNALTDVNAAEVSGSLLYWNGSEWDDVATSSLNLDADLLDGQNSTYYLDLANATGDTDDVTEGSTNLFFTDARARGSISETITGLLYNDTTGVFSTDAGYAIPLTASTTNWNIAFNWGDHSAAGYLSSVASSDLSLTNGYIFRGGAGNTAEATSTLFIAENGNVGVGTTSPESMLHISSISPDLIFENTSVVGETWALEANTPGFRLQRDGNTVVLFEDDGNTNFYESDGLTNAFSIRQNGNIGLSTSTPFTKLTVAGDAIFTGGLYDNNYTRGTNGQVLQTTGSGLEWVATSTFGFLSSVSASDLALTEGFVFTGNASNEAAATSSLFIAENGNVGIGTTSPSQKLHIEDGFINLTTATDAQTGLLLTNTASVPADFKIVANSSGLLTIVDRTPVIDEVRLSIDSSGNVGIGTTTPNDALVIDTGNVVVGNDYGLRAYDSSGTSVGLVKLTAIDNTFVNASAGNSIVFGHGGLAESVFDSMGNLGLSTTTPFTKLTVAGDAMFTGGLYDNNYTRGTNGQVLQTTGSGLEWVATSSLGIGASLTDLALTTGSTLRGGSGGTAEATSALFIADNRNIGIGTISPSSRLTVSSSSNSLYTATIQNTGGSAHGLSISGGSGAGNASLLSIKSNSDNAIFEVTDNNVGIGTTTPSKKLEVEGWGAFENLTSRDNDATGISIGNFYDGVQGAYLDLRHNNFASAPGTISIVSDTSAAADNAGAIYFTQSGTPRLVINKTGNVGIGTSSPSAQLHVSGTKSDIMVSSNNPFVKFVDINSTAGAGVVNSGLLFQDVANNTVALIGTSRTESTAGRGIVLATGDPTVAGDGDGLDIIFDTDNIEAARITPDQNFGIGTTSPYAKLSVDGDLALTGGLYDNSATRGISGQILQTTGSGVEWVDGGGSSLFTENASTTYLAALNDNLAVGTTTGAGRFTVSSENSSQEWKQVGSELNIAGGTRSALTTLSPNRVAFFDEINEDLRVYEFNGSTWSQTGTDLNISGAGTPALTTLSPNRIAFIDETNDDLRVYEFNGSTWTQIGSDLNITGVGRPSLTTLSPNRVAFIDSSNDDLRTYQFSAPSVFVTNEEAYPFFSISDFGYTAIESLRVNSGITAYSAATGTFATNGTSSAALVTYGSSNLGGDVLPGANLIYSLGSETNRFKNLWTETLVDIGGNIGIGTTTPVQKLQVYGDIRVGNSGTNGCIEDYGGGNIGGTCTSDERLKMNISPLSDDGRSYIERLVELDPVTYQWNDLAGDIYNKSQASVVTGLIAQDVEDSFPELVSRNDDGYRQVDFRSLPFYILEALREVWEVVTGNKDKIAELEARLESLEGNSGFSQERSMDTDDTEAEEVAEEESVIEEDIAEPEPEIINDTIVEADPVVDTATSSVPEAEPEQPLNEIEEIDEETIDVAEEDEERISTTETASSTENSVSELVVDDVKEEASVSVEEAAEEVVEAEEEIVEEQEVSEEVVEEEVIEVAVEAEPEQSELVSDEDVE